jgi:HK97 family phage major capsid protein
MNINQLLAQEERKLNEIKDRESEARKELEAIIARGEAEGRKNMTADEDAHCERLFSTIKSAQSERKIAEGRVEECRKVKAEDDEADSRMSQVTYLKRSPGAAPTYEMRVGGETPRFDVGYGAPVSRDNSAEWKRSADGRNAVVERGQRFADHDVVRGELERNAERDRTIVGQHGDMGQYLRAMTTSGASAIVPVVWSSEVIDKARNASVMFEAGAQLVPMDAKTVQIGRLTADPAPLFKTEGSPVTPGDMTYDYIQLVATSLTALVVVSMEFLQDAPNSGPMIQSALGKAMGLEIDKAVMFGQLGATGTNDEGAAYGLASPYPKGVLKNLVDNAAGNIIGAFPTNGTAQTAATPWTEMLAVYYKPLRANEKCSAIVSNIALQQQYAGMMDVQYNPIRMPDVLKSVPWLTTNAIPSYTRGTMTSRATDVFAGDFSQVLVGQRLGLEIRVLTERYAENGQVGLLAYWRGDVQVARPAALACYRGLQGAL